MRKIITLLLLLAVVLTTAFSGCTATVPENEVTAQFNDEYEADSNTVLNVDNTDGDISVNSGEVDKITLKAIKRTYYGEDELNKVKITATGSGNEITVRTTYPEMTSPMVSVDMEITVPSGVTVNSVEVVNGDIRISNTKGDTSASCSNGEITMNNINGYVSAQADNGGINIRKTTGINDLEIVNGDIVTDIFDIKDDVTIKGVNGDITAFINPSLNAAIDIETAYGIVSANDIQLTLTGSEETHITGVLGNGGNKLTIGNTNGDVNLKKLSVN
ncbi:DUF4097 domain-containing protein [Methanoplanus endosymbiosus]|uniref:DUF4097 domain-containing protein n=1 Tax=Methanoplanus endosymbiosus TaxID=33865 RepID=A0A9E7PL12_9EURY|nr:DUF4097 domain-containing protein [Methanoplanus endosymbiosus]UUX92123.1 DUF4097 domain-containing protein [Methanoplanus endosymbiosus]